MLGFIEGVLLGTLGGATVVACVDAGGSGVVVFVSNDIPLALPDSKCDGGTLATTGLVLVTKWSLVVFV